MGGENFKKSVIDIIKEEKMLYLWKSNRTQQKLNIMEFLEQPLEIKKCNTQ